MGLLLQIWRKLDLMILAVTILVWGSVVVVFVSARVRAAPSFVL